MSCPLCGFHVNPHTGKCQNSACSYTRSAEVPENTDLVCGMSRADYNAMIERRLAKQRAEADRQWAKWEAEDAAKESRAVEALRKVSPAALFGVLAQ